MEQSASKTCIEAMHLMFNEISFQPYAKNEHVLKDRFLRLIGVYQKAKEKFGLKGIVFPTNLGDIAVTNNSTFYQWVYGLTNQAAKNLILSQAKRPFTNDVLADTGELNRYYYNNEPHQIQDAYCVGLAIAYLNNTISASLLNSEIWNIKRISFHKILNDNLDIENVSVLSVSSEIHLNDQEIISFVESSTDSKLIESTIDPTFKEIHFRDDHGTDILMAFAKRIRNSIYVDSVINSLPFNPRTTRFIRQIYSDGKIEIVLHWEDAGYGMIIQTTGRNLGETTKIASILRDEYDR